MLKVDKKTLHGDTIIEVMMALAIFSIIAIMTVNLMNDGVNSAQRTLEYSMARNEMDAQAEALRYVHQSYVSERQYSTSTSAFANLWERIRNRAVAPATLDNANFDANKANNTCASIYSTFGAYRPFVLNTRLMLPDTGSNYGNSAYASTLSDIVYDVSTTNQAVVYPRIVYRSGSTLTRSISGTGTNTDDGSLVERNIYNRIQSPEGIYIVAVGSNSSNPAKSDYYDFYIHTCWHSIGGSSASTITTIMRLYNPEELD